MIFWCSLAGFESRGDQSSEETEVPQAVRTDRDTFTKQPGGTLVSSGLVSLQGATLKVTFQFCLSKNDNHV